MQVYGKKGSCNLYVLQYRALLCLQVFRQAGPPKRVNYLKMGDDIEGRPINHPRNTLTG